MQASTEILLLMLTSGLTHATMFLVPITAIACILCFLFPTQEDE